MLTSNKKRPICKSCGTRPGRSAGKSTNGIQKWRQFCSSCDSQQYRKLRQVGMTCTTCGFTAQDSCQMDSVDGISICANCNRLRTKLLKQQQHSEYQLTVDSTVDAGGDFRL